MHDFRGRIALARACYSALSGQTKLLLLDSVLEAVDAETDAHIWERAIGKDGILKDCTRVLVTHAAHHLHDVDRVCYMEGGKICQVGSHDELMLVEGQYRRLINEFASRSGNGKRGDGSSTPKGRRVVKEAAVESKVIGTGELTGKEEIRIGRVSGKTYRSFIKYAGWHLWHGLQTRREEFHSLER